MAKVRARGNASTELKVVKLFRANRIKGWRRHLPLVGRPDFSFPKSKVVIFVDGCFWHGCPRCYSAPETSKAFWKVKLAKNKARDLTVNRQLRASGWKVVRVWECRLKNPAAFLARISRLTGTHP
jgi:DNA mismatch endonuclease (patch repair protein)